MNSRDLNLMVGAGLQLQKKGSDERYLVELLGYRVGEGVIISAPQEGDGRVALTAGDEVTVRFSGGASGYSFESRVTHIAEVPYLHVHLTYPEGTEGRMKRRAPRVPIKRQGIRLSMKAPDQQQSVVMEDVSHGGACLVAPHRLGGVGEHFSIDLPAPAPEGLVMTSLPCVVRHVREEQRDDKSVYLHGIEFQELDAVARTFISRFIRHSLESKVA